MNVFSGIKGETDYTELVFWTNMLAKVSRLEIKTMYENLKKFSLLNDVDVYLINDDIMMTKSLNGTL